MKILFVVDTIHPVVFTSAKGLAGRGHEVVLLSSVQVPSEAGEVISDGVRLIRWYIPQARFLQTWRTVYNPPVLNEFGKMLYRERFEIVHFHAVHIFFSYATVALAKRFATHTLFTFHSSFVFWEEKLDRFIDTDDYSIRKSHDYRIGRFTQLRYSVRTWNPLRNFLIRRAIAGVTLLSVSSALKQALEQNGIRPVAVLHNGLNLSEYDVNQSQSTGSKWANTHGLSEQLLIVTGGRISAQKGFEYLLSAFQLVARDFPKALLLVIGNGSPTYMHRFRELVKSANLEKRVRLFDAMQHDVFLQAISSSYMVVVPSAYLDPLPTVTLDGMALRKPVVGSCFGGIPEMVVDGGTGRIVNPLDTKSFAAAMTELLLEPALAQRYGLAGRERVECEFALPRHLDALEIYYSRSS